MISCRRFLVAISSTEDASAWDVLEPRIPEFRWGFCWQKQSVATDCTNILRNTFRNDFVLRSGIPIQIGTVVSFFAKTEDCPQVFSSQALSGPMHVRPLEGFGFNLSSSDPKIIGSFIACAISKVRKSVGRIKAAFPAAKAAMVP